MHIATSQISLKLAKSLAIAIDSKLIIIYMQTYYMPIIYNELSRRCIYYIRCRPSHQR